MWGRRSVAIGVLLIGLAIIGGIVLLLTGGGNDNGSKTSPQVKELQDRFLKHTVVDVEKGISVRRPKDWQDSKNNHVITLTSQDRCLTMTLSAPVDASKANGLHDDSIAVLKRSFKNAQVGPAPNGQQIGGIPTRSNTLRVTEKGHPVRILLSVGKGDKYAYLTEVVLGNPACQADLRLGNLILTSVEYTK
jgi:hypothetical protein